MLGRFRKNHKLAAENTAKREKPEVQEKAQFRGSSQHSKKTVRRS